jgi:hypothetical protein
MSLETFLFKHANHLAILLTIVAIGIASSIVMPLFRKSIDFRGKVCVVPSTPFIKIIEGRADEKHCYITGGSAGLGKALAVILVKRGAHVTIVARDPTRLGQAEEELKVRPSAPLVI